LVFPEKISGLYAVNGHLILLSIEVDCQSFAVPAEHFVRPIVERLEGSTDGVVSEKHVTAVFQIFEDE